MGLTVTHKFTDPHGDGPDTSLVRPSNWNDTHVIAGTLDAAQFPALIGDVTTSAGSLGTTIAANAVTFAKMATAAQGLNFVRNAKTTNYTVANTDKGNLLALGGSTLFTLTLSAASGYDANFAIVAFNEDTTRGKVIAPNGRTSFILWPRQSVIIFNDNNAWRMSPETQPWIVPAGTVFNVDNVNGSDSATNDGLGAQGTSGAFLTIGHAFSVIQKSLAQFGAGINIQLPTTTSTPITEAISVAGAMPSGVGSITIVGNTATPTNCQWQPASPNSVTDYQSVTFNGIGWSIPGGSATLVSVSQFAIADFFNCDFGANAGGTNITCGTNGKVNILSGCSISGNCSQFLQVAGVGVGSIGSSIVVNGTPNVGILANALYGGEIDLTGLSFTGSGTISGQQFLSRWGGIIRGDSGVSWPGGLTAGAATIDGISDGVLTSFNGLGLGTAPIASAFAAIAAGTTAEAQINLASSTAPTSPNNGDIWFDGSNLKIRIGGVTKTVTVS